MIHGLTLAVLIRGWMVDPARHRIYGRRQPVTEAARPVAHLCSPETALASAPTTTSSRWRHRRRWPTTTSR